MSESGEQIGEKLLSALDSKQQNEFIQFIREQEGKSIPLYNREYSFSKQKNMKKLDEPLTEIIESGLYLCLENRIVSVNGQTVNLTAKEFDILALLIMHPRRVFTYEMITELVWQEEHATYSRKAIINHVSNLRRKLKISPTIPEYIKSVHSIGYKFDPTT